MKRTIALGWLLCSALYGMAGFAAEQLPVDDFLKRLEFSQMSVSPDGKYLAALTPVGNRNNIAVIDLDTRKPKLVTSVTESDILAFTWANNDRLLFTMDKDGNESFGIFAVNRDGSKPKVLIPPVESQVVGGSFVVRTASLLDILPDDPDHVLISQGRPTSNAVVNDVVKLNINHGRKRVIARNPGDYSGWFTDSKGNVVGAAEIDGRKTRFLFRKPGETEFEVLAEFDVMDHGWSPLDISYDDKTLYVASYVTPEGEPRDTAGLYTYDLETRKLGELLFEHPDVDVGGVIKSYKRKKLVAATYYTDKPHLHYFDDDWGDSQAAVDAAFPDNIATMSSVARDTEDLMVFVIWDSRTPGTYYLLDRQENKLKHLAVRANWFDPENMAVMQPISFEARDGLQLHGYLTLPPGEDNENLPLIVNPHGGPWARDTWGFNREAQLLANRGYAVIQVNFRGSTGYGKSFLEASYKQWGLKMQDDISDAVAWAVEQGIADPERICIYGGSYGGYATMAGLTYTPELYKCGVNYVGVTSITLLLDTMPKAWELGREALYVQIGDPERDRELLEDRSPVNHVDKIQAPLFMAYGARDPRVVLDHAKVLEKELKKHNKQYELMIKYNEGHGYRKFENQVEYYTKLVEFFDENLKRTSTQ